MKRMNPSSLSYVHFYPDGLLTPSQRMTRFFARRKPAFWMLLGLILGAAVSLYLKA